MLKEKTVMYINNSDLKKVLVTGAMGSLGWEICKKLKETGKYLVIGCDINSVLKQYQRDQKSPFDYFYRVDLTDNNNINFLFSQHHYFDYIIHCAATVYGVKGFHEMGYVNLNNDIPMTGLLVGRTWEDDSKFIFLSSSMVYETCTNHPVKEGDEEKSPIQSTDYGLSKFVNERVVKSTCEDYTIWRPFNIISPYEHSLDENEIGYRHVFADFIKSIVINKNHILNIIGDGLQIRCFTPIDRVSSFIVENLENDKTKNQTFNVGCDLPISMKDLANKIRTLAIDNGYLPKDFPELVFNTVQNYHDDVRKRIPDVSKSENILGWKKVDEKELDDVLLEAIAYNVKEDERIKLKNQPILDRFNRAKKVFVDNE